MEGVEGRERVRLGCLTEFVKLTSATFAPLPFFYARFSPDLLSSLFSIFYVVTTISLRYDVRLHQNTTYLREAVCLFFYVVKILEIEDYIVIYCTINNLDNQFSIQKKYFILVINIKKWN